MNVELTRAIPILRIFSVDKAKEFYVDSLGFSLDWVHNDEGNFPEYLQISRSGVRLRLSEHHGDSVPGAPVLIEMRGLDALHTEITAKQYKFARPVIETAPWGARVVRLTDPFGNRLVFSEAKKT